MPVSDIIVNESHSMSSTADDRSTGTTSLVGWIMDRVTDWEDHRNQQHLARWEEYYRLWRGVWKSQDSTRKSERSKLISPALMQAIEATVAELEEATFGRKNWIDLEEDVEDQEQQQMMEEFINLLLEEYELNDVPSSVAEIYLLGAIYGTGIGKIVTQTREVRTPNSEGDMLSSDSEIEASVILEPIEPMHFVIDPLARNVNEALGMAHIMYTPKHNITRKQMEGTYASGDVGAMQQSGANFEAKGESQPRDLDFYTKVIEYHGLVPRDLYEVAVAGDEDQEVDSTRASRFKNQTSDETGEGITETDEMVEVIVTIANDWFQLRAIENPNFMKDRNIIAYQHETVPNRFWGRGVAERGYSPQKALDAELRARIDSLAYALNPMIAVQASSLPTAATNKFEVYPGRTFVTSGPVQESIQPLQFTPPPLQSFQQSGDLERMVEVGTGAIQAAAPISQNSRNQTASGMSMIMSGFIKRSKRTLRNIERNFLDPWVRKSAWRYMQVDPEKFQLQDLKFIVHSTLGIVAREFEQQQLTNLLNSVPPESPAFWILIRSIFENSSISSREQVLPLLDQLLQQSVQPPEPDPAEQAEAEKTIAEAEKTVAEARKTQAEITESHTKSLFNLARSYSENDQNILEEMRTLQELRQGNQPQQQTGQ